LLETDSKAPDGILKHVSGSPQIRSLDFTTRLKGFDVGSVAGNLTAVKDEGPLCKFYISFQMDPSDEFHSEMNSVKAKDWRSLLEERPTY
jgi:hypothetical protein